MRLSVVIPAFNEAGTIENTLYELEDYLNGYLKDERWEIVVVDDGSTDNTLKILNDASVNKSWLKVIGMGRNYGRGKALRTGFENSSGELVCSLDADLSYAPYHIERMIAALDEHNADIVLASAYCKQGTVKNVPFTRLLLSRFGNMVLRYMFGGGLTVLTCVVRAYKRDFVAGLDLHSNDKEIHLEVLEKARMLGGKIVEIPADLNWGEKKLAKVVSGKQIKRRSTMKIRRFSQSHLFFALLNKPGFIFWIPGYLLLAISLFIFSLIALTNAPEVFQGKSAYTVLRQSMLTAMPSWITMVASFILGIQFFTLGFLTNQNKRNHEEMYRTLNTIYSRIKDVNKS